MSYPEGEWIVDGWCEGVIYPIYELNQAYVHAKDAAVAIIKGQEQLQKNTSANQVVVVSVRRFDMNYPGETSKP